MVSAAYLVITWNRSQRAVSFLNCTYHRINCSVLQGFPALRKTVTAQVTTFMILYLPTPPLLHNYANSC